MDVKILFRKLSEKLKIDFEASALIYHQGSKGTYRENALKDFLREGKLPKRYGIGSGEIVGPFKETSKQSDLIIFDQMDGFSFIWDKDTQIYPIESVFGVIEVKSTLNKTEFLKALKNIKSTKELCPEESFTQRQNPFMRVSFQRPKPFGIVFGYSLGSNSLESLVKNLEEWEAENPKTYWPDLVVVLGEGLIMHHGSNISNWDLSTNEELIDAAKPYYIAYRDDSLFRFLSSVLKLCTQTHLGPVEFDRYFEPAEILGGHVLEHHNRFTQKGSDSVFRPTVDFIEQVIAEGEKMGMISHGDFFKVAIINDTPSLALHNADLKVYFYNPLDLKPFSIEDITIVEGQPLIEKPCIAPFVNITIDGHCYYIPMYYLNSATLEAIPGMTKNKL
jgi:Domain of unknown function (DUF6602)